MGVVLVVLALAVAGFCLAHGEARVAWAAAGDDGGKIRVADLLPTTLWWACAASALVFLAAGGWSLLAWRGRLRGWVGPTRVGGFLPGPPPVPRWFWPIVLGLVVVGLGLRLPRMDLSFYNDESHSYVRLIAGEWKDWGGEKQRFDRPDWEETAFRNSTGNNGFLYTIVARVCHDIWRVFTAAADGEVGEWPVRIPSLLAGLGLVVMVAMILRRVGFPLAGVVAAALVAVHPWCVRYATEGRGYALMMFFVAAGTFWLMRALHTGRWTDWVIHGLLQLAVLWTYPGSLFAVVEAQLGVGCLLIFLIWRKSSRARGIEHFIRWSAGGLVALLVGGFVLAPGIIQLSRALEMGAAMHGKVAPTWWSDTLSFLAIGCGWQDATPGNPVNPVAAGHPLRLAGVVTLWGAVAAGAVWGLKHRPSFLVTGLSLLQGLSLITLYVRSLVSDNVLHWWYALPALPGLLVVASLAVAGLGRGERKWWAGAAMLAVTVAAMVTVMPPLLGHGKSDGRAIVRVARGGDFPQYDFEPITLALWSDAVTYDPPIRWLENGAMLEREMARAAREGRDLYVLTAHEGKAQRSHPRVMRRLSECGEFEMVLHRWGLESQVNDNRLYRWRGADGPAGGATVDAGG